MFINLIKTQNIILLILYEPKSFHFKPLLMLVACPRHVLGLLKNFILLDYAII